MNDPSRIWYASYGSNLRRQRFLCYIQGGIPEGRTEANERSRDRTPPAESRPISLNFELYFAGRSSAWGNGGVAFIRKGTESSVVLGRMYLITDEQFNDVVMQENSRRVDGRRFVPAFDQLASQAGSTLPGNLWYGKLLNVGTEAGHPILTFTTSRADLQSNLNAPSQGYVKTIAGGLKETYPGMTEKDISAYLLRAEGVRGNIEPREIERWVKEA